MLIYIYDYNIILINDPPNVAILYTLNFILTIIVSNPAYDCVASWGHDIRVCGAFSNCEVFRWLLYTVVINDGDTKGSNSPNSRTSREGHRGAGRGVVGIATRIRTSCCKSHNNQVNIEGRKLTTAIIYCDVYTVSCFYTGISLRALTAVPSLVVIVMSVSTLRNPLVSSTMTSQNPGEEWIDVRREGGKT